MYELRDVEHPDRRNPVLVNVVPDQGDDGEHAVPAGSLVEGDLAALRDVDWGVPGGVGQLVRHAREDATEGGSGSLAAKAQRPGALWHLSGGRTGRGGPPTGGWFSSRLSSMTLKAHRSVSPSSSAHPLCCFSSTGRRPRRCPLRRMPSW